MKRGGSYKADEQEASLVHGDSLMTSNKASRKARELPLTGAKLQRSVEGNNSLVEIEMAAAIADKTEPRP